MTVRASPFRPLPSFLITYKYVSEQSYNRKLCTGRQGVLLDWVATRRDVPELTSEQRQGYGIETLEEIEYART